MCQHTCLRTCLHTFLPAHLASREDARHALCTRSAATRSTPTPSTIASPQRAFRRPNLRCARRYRWWGNDLYWFSFTGVVLPIHERGAPPATAPTTDAKAANPANPSVGAPPPPPSISHATEAAISAAAETATATAAAAIEAPDPSPMPPAGPLPPPAVDRLPAGTRLSPLVLNDQDGLPATVEELILRHDRKELLETPVMLDLLERKWDYFAGERYRSRIIIFAAMLLSVFAASLAEPGTLPFYLAVPSTAVTWALFGQEQLRRLRASLAKRRAGLAESGDSSRPRSLAFTANFFGALDVYNFALVPIVTAYRIAADAGLTSVAVEDNALLASLSGGLQVCGIASDCF